MDRATYNRTLSDRQHRLVMLQRASARQHLSAVVVLEGWDAAGKGGIFRRIGWVLDPRTLWVWATGAPSEQERREPCMRRFWRWGPRPGDVTTFSRSWYGRVLVARVEGL